jgi:hypothetical protein
MSAGVRLEAAPDNPCTAREGMVVGNREMHSTKYPFSKMLENVRLFLGGIDATTIAEFRSFIIEERRKCPYTQLRTFLISCTHTSMNSWAHPNLLAEHVI